MSQLWAKMFTAISEFISILKALWDLWRSYQNFQEAQRVKKAIEQQQAREKAADDMEKAVTEDDFNKASDSLHANQP